MMARSAYNTLKWLCLDYLLLLLEAQVCETSWGPTYPSPAVSSCFVVVVHGTLEAHGLKGHNLEKIKCYKLHFLFNTLNTKSWVLSCNGKGGRSSLLVILYPNNGLLNYTFRGFFLLNFSKIKTVRYQGSSRQEPLLWNSVCIVYAYVIHTSAIQFSTLALWPTSYSFPNFPCF